MIEAISLDKSRLFSIVKIIWLVAVVVGGILYLAKNYSIASQYLQTIQPLKLVLSFVLILIMRTLHPHLVQHSLVLADSYLDFKQVSRSYPFLSSANISPAGSGSLWLVFRLTKRISSRIRAWGCHSSSKTCGWCLARFSLGYSSSSWEDPPRRSNRPAPLPRPFSTG